MNKPKAIKEIKMLTIVFIVIGIFGIALKYFEFYNIKIINSTTKNIFEHPLKVSNAALKINLDIVKMHRDMKDLVLSTSTAEMVSLLKTIDKSELRVYKNFNIIETNILGVEGLIIEKEARRLFTNWKIIREEVITLLKQNDRVKAISITKGKGAQHVLKLENSTLKLYEYAQTKAIGFKEKSESTFQVLKNINLLISTIFFILFILISYYVVKRISGYISKNEAILEELEQKKKNFETIFHESPTPMAIHNEDGKILMINKVWEELSGYNYNEIDTIEKWTNNVAPNKPKPRKEHIEEMYGITKRVNEGEFDIITKDGRKIIWVFSSSPFGKTNNKRVVISTATDITELKTKDDLMITQSRNAAMGEMIGMIAHQWRQPLSIISMNCNNMLLDISLDEFVINKAEIYAQDVIKQTEHLSQTIDDFRNFFKPEKERISIKLEEVIKESIFIVKDNLKNNNINLDCTFSSEQTTKVYKRELMQVYINIINNAKDALLNNKVNNAYIKIDVFDDEEYIITKICDNGTGIPETILSKIFEPYFSTKDEKTGTGLGLYMSKMIIEKHLKGQIEVQNAQNGACFFIKLPIHEHL